MDLSRALPGWALLTGALTVAGACGENPGRVEADLLYAREIDLGEIWRPGPIRRVVSIQNAGSTAVYLEDFGGSCDCTTIVSRPDIISPESVAEVEIEIDPAARGEGVQRVSVYPAIVEAGQRHRLAPIVFVFRYQAALLVQPQFLSLRPPYSRDVAGRPVAEADFMMRARVGGELGSFEVTANSPALSASIHRSERSAARVRVSLALDLLGTVGEQTSVTVRSDDPRLSGVTVRADCSQADPIGIEPSVICVSGSPPGTSFERVIEVHTGLPGLHLHLANSDLAAVGIQQHGPGRYSATVTGRVPEGEGAIFTETAVHMAFAGTLTTERVVPLRFIHGIPPLEAVAE